MLFHTSAMADSWSFEKKSTDKVYEFGKTKIILTTDAIKNQHYPDYIVKILENNKLMAQYRNIAFQHIFASKDNGLFVGLSNDGLPGTAIVVFDNKGNLRLEIKHKFGSFDYCSMSVSRRRVWYKDENQDFNFKYDSSEKLKDITLINCKGDRVSLYDVIDKAYNKPIKPTR